MAVPAAAKSLDEVRNALGEGVARTRRDALVFSVATILISLLLIGAALGFILLGLRSTNAQGVLAPRVARGVCTGANVVVAWMFLALLVGQKGVQRGGPWIGASAVLFVLLLLLSYLTPLPYVAPAFFWIVYTVLAFILLGLLGHAYTPRDDYYLGWFGGRLNNPFTYRDEIDRGHIVVGFALALPRMIVGSYGDLVGSAWLWKGLERHELDRAAETLHAFGGIEPDLPRRRLEMAGRESAVRILRWLDKMRLMRTEAGTLRLTDEGERLIGISSWH